MTFYYGLQLCSFSFFIARLNLCLLLPHFIGTLRKVIAAVLSDCRLSYEIISAVLADPLNSNVRAHVARCC